jgi:hypothetical protein
MAERHYVDPKDQHIAAEAVPTHTELSGMYRDAKKETLSPWMHEDERQAALEKERLDVIKGLRKSSLRIGFNLGFPFVLGILLVKLAFFRADTGLSQADAIVLAFVLLFLCAMSVILTFFLLKQVSKRYRDHTLRAAPVTLTTVLSLLFLVMPLYKLADMIIGGVAGYIAWLISLVIASIIITAVLIVIWTSRVIPALIKVIVLLIVFGASVAAMYLL